MSFLEKLVAKYEPIKEEKPKLVPKPTRKRQPETTEIVVKTRRITRRNAKAPVKEEEIGHQKAQITIVDDEEFMEQPVQEPIEIEEEQQEESHLEIALPEQPNHEPMQSSPSLPRKSFKPDMHPIAKKGGKICIVDLGLTSHTLPTEQTPGFLKRLGENVGGSIDYSYESIDELIRTAPDAWSKASMGAIRGVMLMQELVTERSMHPKSKPMEKNRLLGEEMAKLNPNDFLNHKLLEVSSLDQTVFINVNLVFSALSIQHGSVRSIVNAMSNHWIDYLIPREQQGSFTTSKKTEPLTFFPGDLTNWPAALLAAAIKLDNDQVDVTRLPSVVNMLFKHHIKVRFDHARGLYRTKHDGQNPPKIVLPKRPIIDCTQFYKSSEDIDEEQVPSTSNFQSSSNSLSTSKSAGRENIPDSP